LDPENSKFDLDILKKSIPAGVAPNRKEEYLTKEQF
jgi:hypothetical protein